MNPNGIDMAEVDTNDDTRCTYCEFLTHGDYRRMVDSHGEITIVCGTCSDKWADEYREEAVAS